METFDAVLLNFQYMQMKKPHKSSLSYLKKMLWINPIPMLWYPPPNLLCPLCSTVFHKIICSTSSFIKILLRCEPLFLLFFFCIRLFFFFFFLQTVFISLCQYLECTCSVLYSFQWVHITNSIIHIENKMFVRDRKWGS